MLLQIRRERRWPHAYMAAVFGSFEGIVRKWLIWRKTPDGCSKKLIWLLHDILSATAGKCTTTEILPVGGIGTSTTLSS